ncbi:tumor necrosis factor receptor superfamily member 6 [Neoarius graeffei]|uniref:tumor necrosis factor receptor superfamily member 6 n=1 Tax=Neoarius graeffei TaxID=443677 RepID=UPI00298C83CA|nr:tumor necrosis factor receptor superfamily member 6 [Neoarius graeffei]
MKLLGLLCVFWSVVCLAECVRRNDPRRRRRESGSVGFYLASNGFRCSLCSKGTYLKSDCTSNGSAPQCDSCESGSYMDHESNQKNCERCRTCGNNDNMVEDRRCTSTSNTVCRCKEDHYCDKGDYCRICYACSTCEFGIKEPCSLINNTVCNEKQSQGIAVPIFVMIAVIGLTIALIMWVLKRKQKFCFKPHRKDSTESLELLGDPDLKELLPKIAEILGFNVVRKVVRRQGLLPQTVIDNIMDENPRDASERAYQLLTAWYEKHGRAGAYKVLRENLLSINMRNTAMEVHELVKGKEDKRDVNSNGNVP